MTDALNCALSKRLKHAAAPNCILKFYYQEYFTGFIFVVDLVVCNWGEIFCLVKNKSVCRHRATFCLTNSKFKTKTLLVCILAMRQTLCFGCSYVCFNNRNCHYIQFREKTANSFAAAAKQTSCCKKSLHSLKFLKVFFLIIYFSMYMLHSI